jgi:hypothetical protein
MTGLMATETNGERYTLVAENVTYKEMLDTIADGMMAKRPSIHATPLLTSTAWRLDWFFSKLLRQKRKLTKSMARSSHNEERYDNSKIREKLTFEFLPILPYLKQLASGYRA